MTKQQYLRAKGEIALAREDTAFTEALVKTSAVMLHFAWAAQQARLAARSKTTSAEIKKFAPTSEAWRGYFLLNTAD